MKFKCNCFILISAQVAILDSKSAPLNLRLPFLYLSATVQVCFRLQKPVSLLVPHIGRLEYDIYEEIGVPGTKVLFQAFQVLRY